MEKELLFLQLCVELEDRRNRNAEPALPLETGSGSVALADLKLCREPPASASLAFIKCSRMQVLFRSQLSQKAPVGSTPTSA